MKNVVVAAAIAAVAMSLVPQDPQARPARNAVLDRLAGTWIGEGTLQGMESRLHERYEWVLGDRFIRGVVRHTVSTPEGTTSMEGHVYIKNSDSGEAASWWFSSDGEAVRATVRIEPNAIVTEWAESSHGAGRVVSRFEEEGVMTETYFFRGEDGEWQEAGSARLTRS
jgi:hypothetical protein